MAALTRLSIVTPTAARYEGNAERVVAPGAAGNLAALARHAPLLTTLRVGVVAAQAASERVEFAVDGGLMQVMPDRVIILTDNAVARAEVDAEAAREELRRAEEALAKKRGADDASERRAVAWAQAKVEIARRPTG